MNSAGTIKRPLAVSTPSDLEIRMTREFDAPRRLVFDAMTRPEMIRRWVFAPEGWTMTVCEGEPVVGGRYHWQWSGPDGRPAMRITGEFTEVTPPSRIVHTEVMEMWGGAGCPVPEGMPVGPDGAMCVGELVAILELAEAKLGSGVRTTMTMTLRFDSKEAREGALASGMEHGMNAGYQNLDAMLASQA